MDIKEIKTKSDGELKKLLQEKKESLRVARFGASGSKSKNVKEAGTVKKTIARILTETNARKTVKK